MFTKIRQSAQAAPNGRPGIPSAHIVGFSNLDARCDELAAQPVQLGRPVIESSVADDCRRESS